MKMKTKTLERQVRDLQNLIDELQDTHAELKAAVIEGDLGTASMHANDLVGDLESIKTKYATPLALEIDSHLDDDDEEGESTPSKEKSGPADEGIAASKADALHAQIIDDTNKLADKVASLRSAWDAAGYSKDDGVRDDLLLHALDIAGELANPNSDHYADDPSMRRLANDTKRLAENLSDMASDLEAEFKG